MEGKFSPKKTSDNNCISPEPEQARIFRSLSQLLIYRHFCCLEESFLQNYWWGSTLLLNTTVIENESSLYFLWNTLRKVTLFGSMPIAHSNFPYWWGKPFVIFLSISFFTRTLPFRFIECFFVSYWLQLLLSLSKICFDNTPVVTQKTSFSIICDFTIFGTWLSREKRAEHVLHFFTFHCRFDSNTSWVGLFA